MYAKTFGHNGLGGGIGIDPNVVSYVQPVAIVPAGAPIAAVPLGLGAGSYKHHGGKSPVGKQKGYGPPPSTYGAPSLLPPSTYGVPSLGGLGGLGGIGGLGGLGSLAPPPIPAALPPAPVQHIHHHQNVGPQIIPGPYGALPPPPPPPIYKSPPTYNQQPAYNPPSAPRPAYSNPTPVYNPVPSRPAYNNPVPTQYNNNLSPRDQCVCVPVEQCPSYDVIGRVADYQIDPRSKLNSTIISADDGDIVIVKQSEGRSAESTRRRRQSHHRQTIVGDDSITVISSDSDPSQSPVPGGGVGIGGPVAEVPEVVAGGPIGADQGVVGVNQPTLGGVNPIAVGGAAVGGAVGAGVGAATVSLTRLIITKNSLKIKQTTKLSPKLTQHFDMIADD